jgi:plasmid maintenance system antidote protein VapI
MKRNLSLSPVGNKIQQCLDEKRMSVNELALKMRVSNTFVINLCNEITPITEEVANRLESALGIPATKWMEFKR